MAIFYSLSLHGPSGGGGGDGRRRRHRRGGLRVFVGVDAVEAALEGSGVSSRSTDALGDRSGRAVPAGGRIGGPRPPNGPRRRHLMMVMVVLLLFPLLTGACQVG